LANIFLLLT